MGAGVDALQVEVAEETFSRLQALARPFIDTTPEAVILRLMDGAEGLGSKDGAAVARESEIDPNLSHTKPIDFVIDGKSMERPSWNGLLVEAIRNAVGSAKDDKELKGLLLVPFVRGTKVNDGFKPIPSVGISYQGQDANSAWRAVKHIANRLRIPVAVTFVWRDKEAAAHPGVQRTLFAGNK